MAKPKQIRVKAKVRHAMVMIQEGWIDSLTGEEWDILHCPECGYTKKMQWKPLRQEVIRLGEGMLTDEDEKQIIELCKSGPAGQLEARQIMERAPGHSYARTPSEAELREMVLAHGGTDAMFDEMVEKSILDGEPLLGFSTGAAMASTWPKGAGPVKVID